MWCRVLLIATALTCTLPSEINAEPQRIDQIKDVICVLLLSGLQKDDLDASVLEKLQRRNVNIDDMNNESIREQCTTISHVGTTKEKRSPSQEIVTTIRNSYEQHHVLQNHITDETRRTVHDYIDDKNDNSNNQIPNKIVLENFINLYWEMMNKQKTENETTTEPTTMTPVTLKENTSDYSTNNLEYINHMLLSYIAAKLSSTVQPSSTTETTITPKLHIDIISEKIKQLLEQTRNKSIAKHLESTTQANKLESQIDNKSTQNIALNYINEYLKLTDKTNFNTDNQTEKVPELENKDKKNLSDDVINEITEKVRASVLKDLQTHISAIITETSTAVPENTSTTRSTTNKNIQRSKNITTDTSNVLEHLMELFQQLKLEKDSGTDKSYAFTHKKGTRNEFHGPINVVYPPLIPVNYIVPKNESFNPTPIIAYPYNHYSIINNPVVQKKAPVKPEPMKTQFDMLSAFNLGPAPSHQIRVPMKSVNVQTIQSDVGQIPPIMVKMPNTMSINQNIILTTKRPLFEYGSYTDINKYNRDFNEPETGTQFYDMVRIRDNPHREDKSDREPKYVPRNRYASYDEFYKKHLNNMHGQGKHYTGREPRDYDRFHEILERPEGYTDFKLEKGPKLKPRLKVSSRQQMSLHDLKNRPRLEDTHFRNFLKTQQKVNDMLERLLATKSDTRSVETS